MVGGQPRTPGFAATPQPQRRQRRLAAAHALRVQRVGVQPHLQFRAEHQQRRGAGPLHRAAGDAAAEQPRGIDGQRQVREFRSCGQQPATGQPLQRKPALCEGGIEIRAQQPERRVVEPQQSAIIQMHAG